MTNTNDGKLPREYRERKQQGDVKGQGGIPIIEDVSYQMGNRAQQLGSQVSPTLFGESQFKGGFGPVYAIPSVPWQNGDNQDPGSTQWQQWGNYPQAFMPCCMCCQVGYRYY